MKKYLSIVFSWFCRMGVNVRKLRIMYSKRYTLTQKILGRANHVSMKVDELDGDVKEIRRILERWDAQHK